MGKWNYSSYRNSGNHEYERINQGPESERYWQTAEGKTIEINTTGFEPEKSDKGTIYKVSFKGPNDNKAYFEFNDGGNIIFADDGVEDIVDAGAVEIVEGEADFVAFEDFHMF